MISAIPQIGVNAPKPPAGAPSGGADIFLSLLTQEFQASNGLIDPSLSNLNAAQPGTNTNALDKADAGNADPAVADGSAPNTGNSAVAAKKGADKEKDQAARTAESVTPMPTVLVLPTPVAAVPVPVPVPSDTISGQAPSPDNTDVNKNDEKTSPTAIFLNGGNGPLDRLQSVFANKNSAADALGNNTSGQNSSLATHTQDEDDDAEDNLEALSSLNNEQSPASTSKNAKSALSELEKSVSENAIALPKHVEGTPGKAKEAPQVADSSPTLPVPVASPAAGVTDPLALAANPVVVVPNQDASQANLPNNKFSDSAQTGEKGSNITTQVSGDPAKSSKDNDSSAAIKAAVRKDEGQLNQQDGQQAPSPNDPAISIGNTAFHSVVAQQLHVAPVASGASPHTQTPLKNAVAGNNLQAALQQNVEIHNSDLPVSPGLLQSAKLVERLGQAELRVGMQVGDMGGIDIRTSMAHNQLTAEISVEHNELGHMLAANLPSLQERLSEHQMSTANILLQSQTNGTFSGSEQRSGQGNGSQTPVERIPYAGTENFSRTAILSSESLDADAGLDIHI
ncbi:MAG TPA: flagellar hook-length control protein FliK [Terriglobales bacterium]